MADPIQITDTQKQAARVIEELQHNAAKFVKRTTTLKEIRAACRQFFGTLLNKNSVAMTANPVLVEEGIERMLLFHEFCLIKYTKIHAAELNFGAAWGQEILDSATRNGEKEN